MIYVPPHWDRAEPPFFNFRGGGQRVFLKTNSQLPLSDDSKLGHTETLKNALLAEPLRKAITP
jgi:hypothetical protein